MDNYTATEIAYKNGYDKGYEEAANRLQAIVEKCEKVEHFADKTIATLQAEIERLKEEIELLHSDYTYKLVKNKAKSEAIKEFAERFKKKAKVEIYCDNTLPKPRKTYCIEEDDIDKLVKEMVGDNDD